MSSKLHLNFLGGFNITIDNQPSIQLSSHKAQALLCYLAVTGRAHSRSALAGLLWPDVPETNARMNLRKDLSRLRQVVRPYLIVNRDTVSFDTNSEYWLDVQALETQLDGVADGQIEIENLLNATALYHGDFLEGFYVLNAPTFEEWVLLQRGRLRETVLQALQKLTDLYITQGNPQEAIATIQRLLTLEPWREDAHYRLMELHAQSGQRALALTQYEKCRQVLAEELDVEPSTETQELYEQIRENKVPSMPIEPITLAAPANPVPVPLPAIPLHNLPVQTTPFVGREREQRELAHLLTDPTIRLVTILGPGGIGKTHLSIETASTLLDRYQHGIYFIPLAPLSEPGSMVATLAANIGLTFEKDKSSPQEQLLEYLRPRDILLVCDQSSEALQLFIQTGQRVCPGFVPTAADWSSIQQICQLVGGMPLGLILAASWLEVLSCAEIIAEIKESLDFLASDLRDLPERQRSLQAVFDSTWQRLSQSEQDVFKKLAIFNGGFTRNAAQAVAGASLATLTILNHKSLIRHNGNGRYEIHELLRQYALAALADQAAAVRDAHSAYYCTFLQEREGALKGAGQQATMTEIEADGENVRAAWQWATRTGHVEKLSHAIESLGLFYLWQSRFEEGRVLCEQTLTHLEKIQPQREVSSEVSCEVPCNTGPKLFPQSAQLRYGIRAAVWQSRFQRSLPRHMSSQEILRQARIWLEHSALEDLDTRAEEAQLLLEEAEAIAQWDRHWRLEQVEQSLNLFDRLSDNWSVAYGLDLLGRGLRETGQLANSEQRIEDGLALRQKIGDTRGIASSLANLANTVANMGRFEEAAQLYRQSITLFTELNDLSEQAYQTGRLAAALVHNGQFEESFQLLDESIKMYHALNFPTDPGITTILSGFALMHLGRYEEALPYHLNARSLSGRDTGYAWKDLGRTQQAMGNMIEAQASLEKALGLFRKRGDMNGLGQTLGSLGYLAWRQKNLPEAYNYIYENLKIAADTQVYLPSLTALSGIALLHMEAGRAEEALELYTLASTHKHVANSRWYADVAGQYIMATAKTLPSQVIETAQVRGYARQLAPTIQELSLTMADS